MRDIICGIDIGISSVGWCIIDKKNCKLIEMGVRDFESASEAKTARLIRGGRRLKDRKKWRKKQLRDAFVDFGILDQKVFDSKEKIDNYCSYTYCGNGIERPKDDTVYHLRKRALKEKISKRELFLALYNICKTRGHFLLENVDFENNNAIDFPDFWSKFYSLTEDFVDFNNITITDFKNQLVKNIFNQKLIKANDIRNEMKNYSPCYSEEDNKKILTFLLLISGFKGDLNIITKDELLTSNQSKVSIMDIKNLEADKITNFLSKIVELYDLINIHSILNNHEYLCEAAVEKIDLLVELYKKQNASEEDSLNYQKYVESIKAKMSHKIKDEKTIRTVKNMDNTFPNGLYVKEAKAILRKQQEYYGVEIINDEFIEVIASIISARIPFYVGPLSPDGKNAWIEDKKHNFKYSYEYTQHNYQAIDLQNTIKNWKERMISHCTYLPDEPSLPKGSFIYETFSILNELNILYATNKMGERYFLTRLDKEKIINTLFLSQNDVTFKQVEDLLNLGYFGSRNNNKMKKFNNKYTLYHSIVNIIPELKVNTIAEIYQNQKKINELENIILNINLFDEEKASRDYFQKKYNSKIAATLSKLNVTGFYSLSKKFLMEEVLNSKGESMMDILFDDNPTYSNTVNEQMTIINTATDINGNRKELAANKYLKKLQKNNKLSIDLLIDGNKPTIPISRPMIRGLNECFKVYEEILKVYGAPSRLIIETAKDFNTSKKNPKKHQDILKDLYSSILKQLKNKKEASIRGNLESWEEIEKYLKNKKNKQKIELYIRQKGIDLLNHKPINLTKLENYQIDHILPRGFGDDSMDDKMLTLGIENGGKGNRVPLEYINSNHTISTKQYIDFVEDLFDSGLISENKKKRLLLESSENVQGFINQNLVDTRYIIKEFTSILSAYNKVNNINTHIVSLKSVYTNLARKAFELKKNRNFGLQHHAHDACLIAIADSCLNCYFPGYDTHGNFKAYQDFISNLAKDNNLNQNNKEDDENITLLRKAFYFAFGQPYNNLINQIKNTIPLYSGKVLKKSTGEFFNATLYKPDNNKDVLTILKINNSKRKFNSINCVAVDFYRFVKFNKKTGKYIPKHIAIHIPRVIVDQNGNINSNKYKDLIKEHYKAYELLDENDNIKEEYFRFRAFKNDIIYDTHTNYPQLFNIGSIVNKKLEFKHIDINSYNSIYEQGNIWFNQCVEHFNLKNKSGKIDFSHLNIADAKEWLINELEIDKKYINAVNLKLKDINTLNKLCETMSYIYLWLIKPNIPPTIFEQYLPVINNNVIKDEENVEYIKLKYSSLGFRFYNNSKGKLIISGPKRNEKAFKKIRNEKFSWQISKYSV